MAPKIPDRWIPYKAYGKVIEGTRFICFKVPLRRIVQANNSEITQIWDIKTLLKKIPKLGAVIDLTNTNRYYDPKELKSAGVLHKKILMPGRIIPPEDKVTEFMDTVDEFLERDDGSLVGVHCTHGLNRTGYMVCRYLRDRLRLPAASAIDKFEKARGYKIERENYIADLLGKTPPSPDIGKYTSIKPITNTKSTRYKNAMILHDGEASNRNMIQRGFVDETIPQYHNEPHTRSMRQREFSQHQQYTDSKYDTEPRHRNGFHQREFSYNSPLSYEEEVDGHTMRYGKRRPDGTKNRYYRGQNDRSKYFKKSRDSSTDTESFDYRYDY